MVALFFDCDGTLVQTEHLHTQVEHRILGEFFDYQASLLQHQQRFTGWSVPKTIQQIATETGSPIPEGLVQKISAAKAKFFVGKVAPIPCIHDALEQLTSYRRAVGSNAAISILDVVIEEAKLAGKFERIFSAFEVANPKPAPDLWLHMAQQMGVDPKDCIVIGDSSNDIVSAKAAGMRVIAYAGNPDITPDQRAKLGRADHILTSMQALPRLVANLTP